MHRLLANGVQRLCLHGQGGVGKTTALQEIQADLPAGSVMLTYDCYGGGRYLDPSAFRHRSADAFLQLTNELASRLRLPLVLSRHQGSDYPRLFASRLRHAAGALAAEQPGALLVIAIDAADNAITAAQGRTPVEPAFVHDFVLLGDLPANVRCVVTARTGRLPGLRLPRDYRTLEIEPFDQSGTAENVARVWDAPKSWVDDFHHLSSGVPRVQAYAFQVDGAHPSTALDRLRPDGKSLDEVFRQQFRSALSKSGVPTEVARLCAGLIALPRPVPLSDLAVILDSSEAQLTDLCADLAPGIRLHAGLASFTDEDFEHFVREEGAGELTVIQQKAATWLLSRAAHDRYAALNVAPALAAAGRGAELLDLVEREPVPLAVADPVLRREAELQRLRLAIKVCREAGDVARALRFVLIGAEGVKTEVALRELLADNPDLAARFAQETAGRLILSDPELVQDHGPLLFQRLAVDADREDAISVREGNRLLAAWMQARKHHGQAGRSRRSLWEISVSDICATVEAALKREGPAASLRALGSWRPKRVALEVALALPPRLIAEGRRQDLEAFLTGGHLRPHASVFLLVPLALAGRPVDVSSLVEGLAELRRSRLRVKAFFDSYEDGPSLHGRVLDVVLTACELLTSQQAAAALVDEVLELFVDADLRRIDRHYSWGTAKLDLLFRAYALREARARRAPKVDDLFLPRPIAADDVKRRQNARLAEEHDRPLMELSRAVFGVYATVALALVERRPDTALEADLCQTVQALEREDWLISRQHCSNALRAHAAKMLLVLAAAGHDAVLLKQIAAAVHGHWRRGSATPNAQFVERLSLREDLHPSLMDDLSAAAAETRRLRIGAEEKSKSLIGYARLLKPISVSDANAVFNDAVEAASELDREAMAQVHLFETLVTRAGSTFLDPRQTARQLSDIVADAAIRLDGSDHFPWAAAMSALTRLDPSLALANAARWEDENVVSLGETLAPVLRAGLREGTIRPAQAAALAVFLNRDHGVLVEALTRADAASDPAVPELAEEAARDILVRHQSEEGEGVCTFAERHRLTGPWISALLRQARFLKGLPPLPSPQSASPHFAQLDTDDPLGVHVWTRAALIDSASLRSSITDLEESSRAGRGYLPLSAILQSARAAVSARDRLAHVQALAALDDLTATNEAIKALLQAIGAWWDAPSIQAWCRTDLPELIARRLPELTRYFVHGNDDLRPALARTGLPHGKRQDIILSGMEIHADGFGADLIFALAGVVGEALEPAQAAELADWYSSRLAKRIANDDRDQTASSSALPENVDEAVARFVFAYLGDYDLRLRWRAAHAIRRLARVGDTATLGAVVDQYHRRDEGVFRGRGLAFYWIAARLWFVIAWDRVGQEAPEAAALAGRTLLGIALDDAFPHLLIRSFAQDACRKLVGSGLLSTTAAESVGLERVNQTELPRSPEAKTVSEHFKDREAGRRFEFDSMDTLPYWYTPLLRAFASVDSERFLQVVEHWIIDAWGYRGDIRAFDKERRRSRFEDRDWALSSNRHGSLPTLERLNNHLEWHAMWCAAGELLKSEALVQHDEEGGWEAWDDIHARVGRSKLSEPPLWSADLLVPRPLQARHWQSDSRALEEWAWDVEEAAHRAELFPSDAPDYVVVDGATELRAGDRIERANVSSALVDPRTGNSLLRALQTMDDTWDYKLPDEGEDDFEITDGPYRLLGWLRNSSRDNGLDDKDPLRGHASIIKARPGRRVVGACSLERDDSGRPRWSAPGDGPPMFVYEAWGEREKDDERYAAGFSSAGHRLLAHKEQLLMFLQRQELDLIVEVEVTRSGRESRRYSDAKEEEVPEGRFDRLYRLRCRGDLEVAEGCLGAWPNDRPAA